MKQRFGQVLRELRKSKGISQRELATRTGVTFTYISKIENGHLAPPAADTIVRFCHALETPPDELLVLAGKIPSGLMRALGSSEAAIGFFRHVQSMGLAEEEWESLTGQLKHLRRRTVADLEAGDHLCYIYKTQEEHKECLTPFLRQGLERGEKVLYIVDAHTGDGILDYLRDDGLKVEPYLATERLNILTSDETYMRNGSFDPDAMIAVLRSETERALAEGHSALRVTGEMTWALREMTGSERLIEYEAKLSRFLPGSQCLVICQYGRRHFDASLLLDVLATHPYVGLGKAVHHNFFYVAPEQLLESEESAAIVHRWLKQLARHK